MLNYKIGETYISDERIYCFIILDEEIPVGTWRQIKRKAKSFNITYDLNSDIYKIETTSIMVDRQIDVIENFQANIDVDKLKKDLRKLYVERML